MRWKVEVCGNPFDLADLLVAVSGLDACAFTDGDKTFLYAAAFEQMDSSAEVNHAAEALIAAVNTSLRLTDTAAQSLTVGPVVDAHGAHTHFVGGHETVHARDRIEAVTVMVGGNTISTPSPTKPVQRNAPD